MLYKVVLVAYISMQVFSEVLITFGRSSVYRLKRKGPSTDPCGTSQLTGEQGGGTPIIDMTGMLVVTFRG